MALTKELITHHPADYLRLWLRDWLSLQLYPAYWPAWLGPAVGDRAAFPTCHMQGNCWVLDRYDIPARSLLALLAAAAASLAGTLLLLPLALRPMLQRRASLKLTLAWLLAGLAQASLLATSAFEAGLARYATLPHLLGTALLIWMIVEATRRIGVLPRLQAGHRTYPRPAAAPTKALIRAGSFTPRARSTPEETSTPAAPLCRIASATVSGVSPPASSQGRGITRPAVSPQSKAAAFPPGRLAPAGGLASSRKRSTTGA